MRIYKVFRGGEWNELDRAGESEGSPDDRRDGFIHFSTEEQLGDTLARHFKGEEGLILAACDSGDMGGDLKWEGEGDAWPHLHRKLTRDDVIWHKELPRGGIDAMTIGDG